MKTYFLAISDLLLVNTTDEEPFPYWDTINSIIVANLTLFLEALFNAAAYSLSEILYDLGFLISFSMMRIYGYTYYVSKFIFRFPKNDNPSDENPRGVNQN